MTIPEIIFYAAGVGCIYSYFLYPLLLKAIPERSRPTVSADTPPVSMSLIVTVHNEEARVRDKIENSLAIEYTQGQLEIIIASDHSTDGTEAIVQQYADRGVRLVRADARKGKEYAQLCAIREARGEILVFSDVATEIPPQALSVLAREFATPGVGAVSSEDRFVSNDGSVVGEGAYVRYEMWLRRQESARGGLVGLSGSFFAARSELCTEWDICSPSDFNTALNCARNGAIAITCPEVHGIYKDVKDASLEYRRKLRTVIRGMTAITRHPEVLNPFRFGLFAFQVWSHKIMRWGVPWFMLAFAVATVLLQGQGLIYELALYAQLLFYSVAFVGWLSAGLRRNTLVRLVVFFVQTNMALAHAMLQFAGGKRMTVWTPSRR